MGNEVYNELREILSNGKDIPDRVTNRLLMAGLVEALATLETIAKDSNSNSRRLDIAEKSPSLIHLFRHRPIKTSFYVMGFWSIMEYISENLPEFIPKALSWLAGFI